MTSVPSPEGKVLGSVHTGGGNGTSLNNNAQGSRLGKQSNNNPPRSHGKQTKFPPCNDCHKPATTNCPYLCGTQLCVHCLFGHKRLCGNAKYNKNIHTLQYGINSPIVLIVDRYSGQVIEQYVSDLTIQKLIETGDTDFVVISDNKLFLLNDAFQSVCEICRPKHKKKNDKKRKMIDRCIQDICGTGGHKFILYERTQTSPHMAYITLVTIDDKIAKLGLPVSFQTSEMFPKELLSHPSDDFIVYLECEPKLYVVDLKKRRVSVRHHKDTVEDIADPTVEDNDDSTGHYMYTPTGNIDGGMEHTTGSYSMMTYLDEQYTLLKHVLIHNAIFVALSAMLLGGVYRVSGTDMLVTIALIILSHLLPLTGEILCLVCGIVLIYVFPAGKLYLASALFVYMCVKCNKCLINKSVAKHYT